MTVSSRPAHSSADLKRGTDARLHGKVYVVLVNWRSWGHTLECLESILKSEYRDYQIVIVENCSGDDSVERIEAWARGELCPWVAPSNPLRRLSHPPACGGVPVVRYGCAEAERGGNAARELAAGSGQCPLILIETGANLGFGGGNNVALRFIRARGDGDYAWLLNNDTVIEPGTLGAMACTAARTPGIVGCVHRLYHCPEQVQLYGGGHISRRTGRVRIETRGAADDLDFVTGASLLMDRTTLEMVGGFDERIFMYFEDGELCLRARGLGVAFHLAPATVFHKTGASRSDEYKLWDSMYRSHVYTLTKHFGRGPWMAGTAATWALQSLHPGLSAGRRRAARQAVARVLRAAIRPYTASDSAQTQR